MALNEENKNNIEDKTSFLFEVLKRYDHYIATTNFKVGLMMSFIGAIIFGLTVRVISIQSTQAGCSLVYSFAVTFSLLTIIFSLAAAVNLLRVVFPNTGTHTDGTSLIFFGDVANSKSGADGYKSNIERADSGNLLNDLSKQTFLVAEVVNEKFRVLKISVNIIIYAVIPLLFISITLIIIEGMR
ncbi:Pycsar system effector family protein [Psychrobacter urativorans]|uniref:Pycsar system effector family protein n=1 Tax=Psychrobacter urativorans TaxID=45610 RepID=UPI001918DAE1|nr:Pycsar system effector family protein [Psychrobacter urativorans]